MARLSPSPTGDAPDLELDQVTRRFGDVVALERLSLHVHPGEVVGLLGHNGAGKTTTVRLLAGLLAPDGGTVAVGGLDPVTDGDRVRRGLGVLPARPVVDDRLTATQNLRFAAEVFELERDGLDARIGAALATFQLEERADERVGGFSTGMRQRLSLARVLLPDPQILLLDEPTASLDPVAARQVRRLLADLARGDERTVVLCTHDLQEAESLCDRVVVLAEGVVVAEGSPAELAARHGQGGVLVEVAAGQATAAVAALSALGAADVEVEAAGRVRVAGATRDVLPTLVRSLVDGGLDVYEVRRLDPTLEDVYLAIHGAVPDERPVDAEAP